MRKKFRNIVIDGDNSWAWNVYTTDTYYKFKTIKIWKDKKNVFEKSYGGDYGFKQKEKEYEITPGLISRFIKMYLKK